MRPSGQHLTAQEAAAETAKERERIARGELPLVVVLEHIEDMAFQGQSTWQHAMLLSVDLSKTDHARWLGQMLEGLGFTVEWRAKAIPAYLPSNTTGMNLRIPTLTVSWDHAVSEPDISPS